MAIWERPTFETLLQRVLSKIDDKRSGAATGPGSDADILSYTLAHIGHGLYLMQEYGLLHNLIYTKASGWILDAYLWGFGLSDGSGGFGRIKARGSYADDSFTFVALGGPGWVDLDGYTFSDTAGNQYEIDESYTPTGAGTTPALRVIGIGWDGDNGADTNVEVSDGETFTWDSTPPQMDSTITQVVDLDHGANRETDSEGRARLVKHLQTAAMGGNWAHWREVAEEADPGNIDCFVYYGQHNNNYAYSCTDVACLQRGEVGDAREIQDGDDLHQTIEDALEDALPWGAMYQARVLDTNVQTLEVELSIVTNSTARDADKCDWDAWARDQAGGCVVSAYSEVNKTITCSNDIHEYIEVGDRVIIKSAQAVVTKVGVADGLGANTMFEVSAWFEISDDELNPYYWANGYDPTGDHVTSGGGHILACHTALRNLFSRLGPGKGNNAAPIPGWDEKFRLKAAQSALIQVGDTAGEAAIIDVVLTAPITDISPAAGSGVNAYVLTQGEITIWENKT
jgi:hypothetical protein